jgi:hypothetical protein
MKNLILFTCLLLFVSACKEKFPYDYQEPEIREIKGIVYNYQSKKPIKDMKLRLISNQKDVVDSVFSDENGAFKASFLSFYTWDHELDFIMPSNYYNPYGLAQIRFNENRDVYISPYSYLKLNIKNQIPFDADDKIEINIPSVFDQKDFIGAKLDTSLLIRSTYYGSTNIEYTSIKNSLKVVNKIPIKIIPLDTVQVTIKY